MVKKLICVFAVLILLSQPASAAEPTEYSEAEEIYRQQFEASGVGNIYNSLPIETRNILGSMGLDPQTGELPELSPQNVFEHILTLFKGGFKRPFAVCTSVLGIVLIVSAVAALAEKSSALGAVSLASSLCVCITVLLPMFQTITVAVNALKGVSGFMTSFIPIFCASVVSAGFSATGAASSAVLMAASQGLSYLLSFGIPSFLGIYLALSAVAPVSPFSALSSPALAVKRVANWTLTTALTVFLGVLGIQTGITSASDSLAMKTVRYVAGNIPVVGNAVGETVSVVRGSVALISTSSAGYGAIAVAALLCPVILEMVAWRLGLNACGAVCGIFGDKKTEELLRSADSVWGFMIGITLYVGLLFIISLAIVAKAVRGV